MSKTKTVDLKGAIKMLRIAHRNFDTSVRNLCIAVALECLGVRTRPRIVKVTREVLPRKKGKR